MKWTSEFTFSTLDVVGKTQFFKLVINKCLYFCIAEQLAKDLELFAQHASRKIVKMEDVILSGEFSKYC